MEKLEFKGTKGSRHIDPRGATIMDDNGKSIVCWYGVATSTFEEDEIILKANSYLMASSYDLLEALQNLLLLHSNEMEGIPPTPKEWYEAVKKGEKAIEKALKY